MKEVFVEHRFQARAEETLVMAEAIINEMQGKGYTLTLRQLFYQFVGRDKIANVEKEYKRLGDVVKRGREAGRIDWDAIEDRNRAHYGFARAQTPADAIKGLHDNLRLDPWLTQKFYVEVWVEKQALEAVVGRGCRKHRARYMACKGYLSTTEAYEAGQRFAAARASGRQPIMIHLGDHDPSGMDMTRDNGSRLSLFSREGVQVDRIALNMDQIDAYKPPPNPAKVTDSRAEGYVEEFGTSSWELDALPPGIIETLIEDHIAQYVDEDAWEACMDAELEMRNNLLGVEDVKVKDLFDFAQRIHGADPLILQRIRQYDEWAEAAIDNNTDGPPKFIHKKSKKLDLPGLYGIWVS